MTQLSITGNREEFCIPQGALGTLVCSLPLVWGRVDGRVQACIYLKDVQYPSFQRLTRKEAFNAELS